MIEEKSLLNSCKILVITLLFLLHYFFITILGFNMSNNQLYLPYEMLIVDDESMHLTLFERYLQKAGFSNIVTCSESDKVLSLIEKNAIKLVLLDLNMPVISGYDLLLIIKDKFPDVVTLIVSGENDFETAISCMKNGAFDYILKPIIHKEFISRIIKATKYIEIKAENKQLKKMIFKKELKNPKVFKNIITSDETMLSIFRYFEAISKTTEPVLITGDTGVGKELFAEAFYTLTERKGSLIKINVAGLDDQMFSDTIFGHKKGAFTDAVKDRAGLIEKAVDGVIFLDEIGDLSKTSQIKLLRLIQEHEYYPLGSDTPKYSNALIIAATNKDLKLEHENGNFRKDLYYRLNTHIIKTPALKKRINDIEQLVDFFLKKFSTQLNKKNPTIPKQLLDLLKSYSYPGNIRELRSMVYEAISLHQSGILSMSSFKNHIGEINRGNNNNDTETLAKDNLTEENIIFPDKLPTIKEIQEQLVAEAMKRSNNNQNVAAGIIGISRQAINKRLKGK